MTSKSWKAKTSAEIELKSEKETTYLHGKIRSKCLLFNVRKKSAIANSIGREFILFVKSLELEATKMLR